VILQWESEKISSKFVIENSIRKAAVVTTAALVINELAPV
jgi:hypothetical protein